MSKLGLARSILAKVRSGPDKRSGEPQPHDGDSELEMIHFLHVGKSFPGGRIALEDVSFHLERGEFAFLSGASGAGKTTLLKLIYREIEPSSGQILVNGRNVAAIPRAKVPFLRRTIGVVFQNFRLISRKTVLENVSYLPRILGMSQQERKRLAYTTLRRVGLAHRMSAFPSELSGGEQQRVTIARALINRPEILIADEPTGNLDPELSWEILRLFLEINSKGTTVLLATHEHVYVSALGGRSLVLDRGRLIKDVYVEGQAGDVESDAAEEAEDRRRTSTERPA